VGGPRAAHTLDDAAAATSAKAPTDAQVCADLKALPDEGGPTDELFKEHPDPTLDDWAAGLPDVIDKAQHGRDRLAAVEPSPALADERQAALDAFDGVIASFEKALDAAKAHDQHAFDAEEAKNQDDNVPKLMDAFNTLMTACGAHQG
jgi:hypothetical protein